MAEEDKGVGELLERLLEGRGPKELVGSGGLPEDLTKLLYEKALEGEMTARLACEKHALEGRNRGNSRNGRTTKRLKRETGKRNGIRTGQSTEPAAETYAPRPVHFGARDLRPGPYSLPRAATPGTFHSERPGSPGTPSDTLRRH